QLETLCQRSRPRVKFIPEGLFGDPWRWPAWSLDLFTHSAPRHPLHSRKAAEIESELYPTLSRLDPYYRARTRRQGGARPTTHGGLSWKTSSSSAPASWASPRHERYCGASRVPRSWSSRRPMMSPPP